MFPTVGKSDCAKTKGKVFDGLPSASLIAENYPADDVEGNDDAGILSEDNYPYSDQELRYILNGKEVKNQKGQLSSYDKPRAPAFINATGKDGDTVEQRAQFREFARLQIGDNSVKGYKNWYRISDYSLWRHHAKFKKEKGKWKNNGSVSDKTNADW